VRRCSWSRPFRSGCGCDLALARPSRPPGVTCALLAANLSSAVCTALSVSCPGWADRCSLGSPPAVDVRVSSNNRRVCMWEGTIGDAVCIWVVRKSMPFAGWMGLG
jgi:hypothetical protein